MQEIQGKTMIYDTNTAEEAADDDDIHGVEEEDDDHAETD